MGQANRSNFDHEWENAFAEARMSPSPEVWQGIEQALDTPVSGNRKRIFLIQLAMAASVLFAMSIGAAGVYQLFNSKSFTNPTISEEGTGYEKDTKENSGPAQLDKSKSTKENTEESTPLIQQENNYNADKASVTPGNKRVLMATTAQENPIESLLAYFTATDKVESKPVTLENESALPAWNPKGVPNVVIIPKTKHQDQWASLGFSAGNYSAGSGNQNSFALSQSDVSYAVGQVSEESKGTMYQVEMNFGKQVARRWVVQGGVGYMQRNSEGSSNIISARGEKVANLASLDSKESLVIGDPYSLENTMQVMTLPVQVGYILLDKRMGVRVLTGIANELMIKYQIDDSDGNLGSQTYRPGDSDDYNRYGMSALVTTELSYAIADKYQVAIFPQLRQSLIPLMDTDQELPMSMEIGFRVRYMIQ
jgi:hypothetical protein